MKAVRLNQAIILLSCLGVFIAGVLTMAHFFGRDVPCGAGNGCSKVIESALGTIGPVPTSILGLGAYLIFLGLAIARGMTGFQDSAKFTKASFWLSGLGLAFSLVLTIYSVAVVNDVCLWCMGSGATMFLLFVTHYLLYTTEPPETRGLSMADIGITGVGIAASVIGLVVMSGLLKPKSQVQVVANSKKEMILGKQTHIAGNPNGDIILVEFLDLSCPTCRRSYGKIKELTKQYPRLKVVLRHFPFTNMEGHEMSVPAALVAELAHQQGRFWDFMDNIMNPQIKLESREQIKEAAASIGLKKEIVEKAVVGDLADNDPALLALQEDMGAGEQLGLNVTPTYFLIAPNENILVMTLTDLEPTLNSSKWQAILKG